MEDDELLSLQGCCLQRFNQLLVFVCSNGPQLF